MESWLKHWIVYDEWEDPQGMVEMAKDIIKNDPGPETSKLRRTIQWIEDEVEDYMELYENLYCYVNKVHAHKDFWYKEVKLGPNGEVHFFDCTLRNENTKFNNIILKLSDMTYYYS